MRALRADRLTPAALAVLAAGLYLWDLGANGYGNSYYAAAALAASKSWSAWFFGSFDAGDFITIDKPPLSTMVTGLAVRVFGLSSWSVLVPQALMGVATVLVLYYAVRRSFGAVAAAIAALVMALTPVSALMFRLNDPDALLTLLLVVAASLLLRGVEDGRPRWAIAAAAVIGLAFLTKYLQAYLVLPAFALVWIAAARATPRRRIVGLAAAAGAVLVSSAWWVAVVDLIPSTMRPYIGGSSNDSALDLLLGYDGLQRIFGFFGRAPGRPPRPDGGADGALFGGPAGFGGPPPGGPPGGGPGFGGTPGPLRMFNDDFIGEIAWLLPLALLCLAVGLAVRLRSGREDRARSAYLLWGTWLVVTLAVFSFMSGIIHPYYTVMLVPPIGALVGGGLVDLWRLRARGAIRAAMIAVAVVGSALVAVAILGRAPSFAPLLRPTIVAAAIAAAVLIAVPLGRPRLHAAAAALGVVAILAGPASYAYVNATTLKTGAIPGSGPAVSDRGGPPGPPRFVPAPGGSPPNAFPPPPNGFGPPPGGFGPPPGGFGPPPGGFGPPAPGGFAPPAPGGFGPPPPGGPAGAPGSAFAPSADLTSFLAAHKGSATWIVAVRGAQEAGSLQLATGEPVMAIGGFSGMDPTPSLAELKSYVASGRLRYVLITGPGGPGGPGGPPGAPSIEAWVRQTGAVVNVGALFGTLYDVGGR